MYTLMAIMHTPFLHGPTHGTMITGLITAIITLGDGDSHTAGTGGVHITTVWIHGIVTMDGMVTHHIMEIITIGMMEVIMQVMAEVLHQDQETIVPEV